MTGRRLYELVCDGWGSLPTWDRTGPVSNGEGYGLARNNMTGAGTLPAWPFLSAAERTAWSRAAARIKGVKR
jgi:hypothetical protein